MKSKTATYLVVLSVIFIVFVILFIKHVSSASIEDSQFIGERTTLYVQTGCSHCERQLSLFGENIKYIAVIDCFKEPDRCQDITYTPTWVIDNNKYEGFKSVRQLKVLISKNYLKDIEGDISKVPVSELGKSCPLELN